MRSVAETEMLARLLSLWGCDRESVPCLFQILVAAGMPWLVAASFWSPTPESYFSLFCSHRCFLSGQISLWLLLLYVIVFRAHSHNPG